MKKKILTILLMTTMVISLSACGKQKDTGVIVSVGDNGKDSGLNDVVPSTENDSDTKVTEENTDKSDEKSDDKYIDYITGGFVTENGDVYQFNKDNTYSYFIAETGNSSSGTYETDGKSYMTLKCTNDNSGTDEETADETPSVSYKTEEQQEDGTILVTEYDEMDNVINQYVQGEVVDEAPITEEEAEAKLKEQAEQEEGNTETPVISEITYKLTVTTTTDEYGNTIDVVVLSKGDTKIVLQKQFNL